MKVITDKELFTYIDCSQKYYFSTLNPELNPIKLDLLGDIFADFIETSLVNELNKDSYSMFWKKCIEFYLEQDKYKAKIDKRWAIFKGTKAFEQLCFNLKLFHLYPIVGPFEQNIKINEFSIQTKFLGIARNGSGALRGFVLTPYINSKDIKLSVVHQLQREVLIQYCKDNNIESSQSPKLITIGLSTNNNLYKSLILEKKMKNFDWKKYLNVTSQLINKEFYYPNVPCRDLQCPYYKQCVG